VESQRAITFQNTLVPRPLSSPLGCMPCRHSDRQFHYMFWCSAISPQPPRGRGEFGVSPLTSLLHAFFQSHLLCVSMWGCGDVGVCVSARESPRARYTVTRDKKMSTERGRLFKTTNTTQGERKERRCSAAVANNVVSFFVSICHKIVDQSKGGFLKKSEKIFTKNAFVFNNKGNEREFKNSANVAPL